ncbi:hypothetical protein AAFC00_000459 [Neodothiora populina]|uniref:Methylthioribulose-1-phosphate dehydratase n=1 Tax=Neodothiora populina TaxID=2781224 RepID=A0ABR3PCY6_9PEZI
MAEPAVSAIDGVYANTQTTAGRNDNNNNTNPDALITSPDHDHPANLICSLCRQFYTQGWVTGTGGGTSIKKGEHIFLAPSGVQKELMQPKDLFVMDAKSGEYIRRPEVLKPSACTPLFMAAYTLRDAGCCIHTHSIHAVLVTLLCESLPNLNTDVFEIEQIEQIKGIARGYDVLADEAGEDGKRAVMKKAGNLGYFDRLRIPIIENTAHEEDLRDTLEEAIKQWPDAHAVLVRRHGIYVWGRDVAQAKTQCESLDYIFQLAVEMHKLGLPWTKN